MNTTHELESRLAAFYANEQPLKAPDRVLLGALTAIEATPQRRVLALAPWRFRPMNRYAMFAGATAAIVAVAFTVVGLQPNPGSAGASGSPPATATPSATVPSSIAVPSASLSPTSVAAIPLPSRSAALAPGRYSIPVLGTDISVELTLGDTGWSVGYSGRYISSSKASLTFGTVTNVYANACIDSSLPQPAIGPTVDDLVRALDAQKNTVMEQRSNTFVDGHPSTRFIIRPSEGITAACPQLGLWWNEGHTKQSGFIERITMNRAPAPDGKVDVFWVVDVDGTRVIITAYYNQAKPGPSTSIQGVIDSIQFVRS
jgi:hypothetical protein